MSGTLTVSGTEITDALRLANLSGDARAVPDSSFGLWATTNLCTNGGMESNTTGWDNSGVNPATLARVTSQFKFGIAALSVACPGALNFEGATNKVSGAAAATQYTASVWVFAPLGATLTIQAQDHGGVTTNHNANFTGTGAWQRITLTFTTVAATTSVWIMVFTNGTQVVTFYLDGVQLEAKAYVTPYVETNGGSASRSGRPQAPVAHVDETQTWAAFRIRYGFASTVTLSGSRYLFDFRDDANNLLGLWLDTANKWNAGRLAASAGSPAQSAAQVFAKDDTATIIFACTATAVKVSVNGGAFVSVANSSIPTLAATLFDMGSQGGTLQLDGDVFWAAFGLGTLTDADAATINAFGNTDKAPEDFNIATGNRANSTATMPFSTSAYLDGAFVIIDPKSDGTSRGLFPRLRVDIDFTNEPTNPTRVWSDVTSDVRALNYKRAGRSNEIQRTEPGPLNGTLNNRHGKYDRTNPSSPYYPNVKRYRWIRVRARWNNVDYTRWTGFVTAWRQKWPGNGVDATVDIEGVDSMTVFRLFDLVGLSYGSQRTDQRVSAVCTSVGTTAAILSNGSSSVDAIGPFAQGSDALAHLTSVEEHENGLIYAEGDGTITFQDRHYRILYQSLSKGTIGDQAGEIRYKDGELDDDTEIWNTARVTPVGGSAQSASNTPSQTSYFQRVLTRVLLNTSSTEALSAAQYLVARYGDPSLRIPSLDLIGEKDTSTWPSILGMKNSDRWTWKRRASAHTISQDVYVERVGDTWSPETYFRVGLELSPADEQQGWLLGDATYGLLGSTTRLTY